MVELNEEFCKDLEKCVEDLTTSGTKELDKVLIKKLKNICKKSNEYVERAYQLLMIQFEKMHCEIRYSTLLIVNELFERSHHFRNLLLSNFEKFLELSVETNKKKPLPPPKAVAQQLKIKCIEIMRAWHSKFSEDYILLQLGFDYMKDVKKIDFEDVEQRSQIERFREQEEQLRTEAFYQTKVKKAIENMSELSKEIQDITKQMDTCFRLLVPPPDDFCLESTNPSMLPEETDPDADLRLHGFSNRNETITIDLNLTFQTTIQKTQDNQCIIENLRDLYNLVKKDFIPRVIALNKIFVKGTKCDDSLKKSIDLKQYLQTYIDKFLELNIQVEDKFKYDSENESDEFEEVKELDEKEGYEPIIPPHLRQEYGLDPLPSTSKAIPEEETSTRHWNLKNNINEINDPTSRLANLMAFHKNKPGTSTSDNTEMNLDEPQQGSSYSKRQEMLSKAPKLNYDVDLYHWEDEDLKAPTVVKFDSLHKFWQPIENETTETQEKDGVAALRTRVIDFSGNFVPVKWKCRAVLPNGQLCPRQDRLKCPFHGPIIPRDELGNPAEPLSTPSTSKPKSTKQTVPDWQDPTLLAEIKAATGIDLKMPEKGKRRRKKKNVLTDLKKLNNTTRKRLEKKVFNRSSVNRVASTLDNLDYKRYHDKYANQWNYSMNE